LQGAGVILADSNVQYVFTYTKIIFCLSGIDWTWQLHQLQNHF